MSKTDLWRTINHYCVACGGSPATRIYGNVERQRAVVAVEKAILEMIEAVWIPPVSADGMTCPHCGGSGYPVARMPYKCGLCGGTGHVLRDHE